MIDQNVSLNLIPIGFCYINVDTLHDWLDFSFLLYILFRD